MIVNKESFGATYLSVWGLCLVIRPWSSFFFLEAWTTGFNYRKTFCNPTMPLSSKLFQQAISELPLASFTVLFWWNEISIKLTSTWCLCTKPPTNQETCFQEVARPSIYRMDCFGSSLPARLNLFTILLLISKREKCFAWTKIYFI